ncbi:MAG: hypothetical protein QXV83_00600 [Candidatus Anstonellaceae archaeon]
MIIYCFDINSKNLKVYNKIKRRFYYNLAKLKKKWITKSVIICSKRDEKFFDEFFSNYKDFLVLYKIKAKKIQHIY